MAIDRTAGRRPLGGRDQAAVTDWFMTEASAGFRWFAPFLTQNREVPRHTATDRNSKPIVLVEDEDEDDDERE